MAYDNSNSGMLAKNKRRTKDTHPEYSGSVTVDGVEYWLSAWVKTGKPGSKLEGERFFSLSFTRKDGQQSNGGTTSRPSPDNQYDDDIPF